MARLRSVDERRTPYLDHISNRPNWPNDPWVPQDFADRKWVGRGVKADSARLRPFAESHRTSDFLRESLLLEWSECAA